jgi:phosphorylcholine metabolism protein LicD
MNKKKIIVLILIFLMVLIFNKNIRYNINLFFYGRDKLDKIQKDTKELLYHFDKITKDLNISYCIESGTLLGSIRHSDMIPWDDDIDIQLSTEDMRMLLDNVDYINKLGFKLEIERGEGLYKFKKMTSSKNDPFVDIFEVEKQGDKIVYKGEWCKKLWPNYWFKVNEKYPLKPYKFGNLIVLGPNNPYPYLERSYGNWKRETFWGHHLNVF